MLNEAQFKKWLKERDETMYSFNVEKFKAFYRKWAKKGVYSEPLPGDDIIEIMLRQAVCAMANPKPSKLKEAQKWLKERGYNPNPWG